MLVRSAGYRSFDVTDDRTESTILVRVLYPSDGAERVVKVGPYELNVVLEVPVAAGVFPLVVVSHGTGGTGLVYRDTAAYLARHGFVVALPEHPGNNRNDDRLANTLENLENRPRHVSLVVDWALGSSPFVLSLRPATVALVGHSMGGYTALAAAGGVPTVLAHRTPNGKPRRVEVRPDERVRALVLLAPATEWFTPDGALECVRVPILMLTAEKDEFVPASHAESVERGLPEACRLEHRSISNAGHFAFESPFPPAMCDPAFLPSQDPPGFDRARFNGEMNAEICAFLERALGIDAAH